MQRDSHKCCCGAQVPSALVDEINTAIADVRGSLESAEAEELRSKVDALQKSLVKIGEHMAKGGGAEGSGSAGGAGADSGTYDADVKDDKK